MKLTKIFLQFSHCERAKNNIKYSYSTFFCNTDSARGQMKWQWLTSIEEMVSKDFCFHFIAMWYTAKTFTQARKYGSKEGSSRMRQSPHWTDSSSCAFDDRILLSPGLVSQIRMSPFVNSKRWVTWLLKQVQVASFSEINGGYVPQI
jgi:hypothetical protein